MGYLSVNVLTSLTTRVGRDNVDQRGGYQYLVHSSYFWGILVITSRFGPSDIGSYVFRTRHRVVYASSKCRGANGTYTLTKGYFGVRVPSPTSVNSVYVAIIRGRHGLTLFLVVESLISSLVMPYQILSGRRAYFELTGFGLFHASRAALGSTRYVGYYIFVSSGGLHDHGANYHVMGVMASQGVGIRVVTVPRYVWRSVQEVYSNARCLHRTGLQYLPIVSAFQATRAAGVTMDSMVMFVFYLAVGAMRYVERFGHYLFMGQRVRPRPCGLVQCVVYGE